MRQPRWNQVLGFRGQTSVNSQVQMQVRDTSRQRFLARGSEGHEARRTVRSRSQGRRPAIKQMRPRWPNSAFMRGAVRAPKARTEHASPVARRRRSVMFGDSGGALCKNRAPTIFASRIGWNDEIKEDDGKQLSWCAIERIVSTMYSNRLKSPGRGFERGPRSVFSLM
jgi:hypothetical protein